MDDIDSKIAEKIGIFAKDSTVNVNQFDMGDKMSSQEESNRKTLLNIVKDQWIKGVLDQSLDKQISIILELEERPSEVASPWNVDFINADKSRKPLPKDTPVIDVFDQLGEGSTLLILGEAGSGKTITLLQLARDSITRAEQDYKRRIPVVLNLSSWASKTQTIDKWIVSELRSKYYIPEGFGQQWVEKQELLLLLDGLDEIRDLAKRNNCVIALDDFQKDQATEMVVCCRINDYKQLGKRLKLRSAIVLKPLTSVQIQAYIDQFQSNLTVLKTLLSKDKDLAKLAESPLMLNIMVIAYQGIEVAPETKNDSNREKQLFEDYVDRMFQSSRLVAYAPNLKSEEKQLYSRQYATHCLVWIAQKMILFSESTFLIEKMQPSWLSNKERIFYVIEFVLIVSMFNTVFVKLLGTDIFGISAVVLGVLSGILVGINFGMTRINLIDSVIWSWKYPRFWFFKYLSLGLIISFVLSHGQFSIIRMMTLGLISSLTGVLRTGFVGIGSEIRQTSQPNQGIVTSGKNAITIGLICLPIYELFFWQVNWLVNNLKFSLLCGLIFGLLHVTNIGGKAYVQHFVLRLTLFFKGSVPLNYAKFLDWASINKLFLHKVGGGYIFIHRSLMEHFAKMESSQ